MPVLERTRTHTTVRRSTVTVAAMVGAVLVLGAVADRYGFAGLAVDRGALTSWLSGGGLYAFRDPVVHLGTAMSPPTAFFLLPSAWVPLRVAGWLLALCGVTALVLAAVALAAPMARRHGRPRWIAVLLAVAMAVAIEPVRATLGLGTLDLLVFGLLVADVVALRRGAWVRSREAWWPGRTAAQTADGTAPATRLRRGWANGAWAGVGTGLATVFAMGSGLFIVYLGLTRQWRPMITALITSVTLAAGALVAAPHETAAWFAEVFWRLDRTGGIARPDNQSLAGVLARLYDSATTPVLLWSSFAMLLLAVGLIRARSAHAEGDEVAAFTVVGLTGAIVGPVTGIHELIWVFPALLILIDVAARHRTATRRPVRGRRLPGGGVSAAAVATLLLFATAEMWTSTGPITVNAYALALILLVNALPHRPGAAPAFPVDRWSKPNRLPMVPAARRTTDS
ncbi:glycosyltransferase 87 family protein [Mangrovihabitans endophyticus]|uniref:Alpha-1,2-mannosyltransferase n=1 Tax=Mangrovihabitans endophyticus TaxID=1751298 RepID=A0A8J3C118_9ACTN|nr:glycosyltransferase 87 family protein [Mangrovihabitans endophyticus]GGK93624.1 hypothetical protein GCM10012284_29440 [Mangrovihabitans endophyticus]